MEIWSFSKICCNSEATLAWTGFVCWDSQWEVAESEESPRNARGCWRGGEAAGEGSFSLQRGQLPWSQGELHPSTICNAWRRQTLLLSEVQRRRSYSHRFHRGNFLSVEEKTFFTAEAGEPSPAVRRAHWSPAVQILQPCLDEPREPRPCQADLARSLPASRIPGFKASADIRRRSQRKEKINLAIEEPASLYLLPNMNSIQRPWKTFSCKN